MFDSRPLAGHSGYIPSPQELHSALVRQTGTCSDLQKEEKEQCSRGHREQGLGLAGLHNPAGGLGGTTGRQGPPSAGRSPSPGVTHSKRSSSHILPFDSLTVFQCHALWRRAVQLCVFGIIANHIKLPSLTQYSIKLSILIFMAFALIPRLFWLELMAHLFAS